MYLENTLYPAYLKNGFGKILKSEIDLHFFHYFLLQELPSHLQTNEQINYTAIEKKHLYQLAHKANITIERLQTLLTTEFNVFGKHQSFNLTKTLLQLLQDQSKFTLATSKQHNKIRLSVTNPILRQLLVQEINLKGGLCDYSLNKDIVEIDFIFFLGIIDQTDALYKEIEPLLSQKEALEPATTKQTKLDRITKWFANAISNQLEQQAGALLANLAITVLSNL